MCIWSFRLSLLFFFFSSRRRHTRFSRDWSSDVCSSDLTDAPSAHARCARADRRVEDLPVRPRHGDPRGRSVHEQMVHQCVSEDLWFRNMLGIDVGAPPLPKQETRFEFMKRYAEDSGKRLAALREKNEPWWEESTKFFDVQRSRAWVMTRRLTHSSHHRG